MSCASRSGGVQHATPFVVVAQRLPRGTRFEAEVRLARLDAAPKQITCVSDAPRRRRNRGLLGPAYVAGACARQYFFMERLGCFPVPEPPMRSGHFTKNSYTAPRHREGRFGRLQSFHIPTGGSECPDECPTPGKRGWIEIDGMPGQSHCFFVIRNGRMRPSAERERPGVQRIDRCCSLQIFQRVSSRCIRAAVPIGLDARPAM